MKKYVLYTLFSCLLTVNVLADTFDDVVAAIKNANAKEVARFFNSSVELTVLNSEGVYSKQQAEIILKNFLAATPPKNVTIQHKGSSAQGSKYAIAVYECQQGKYRAYIFMKDSGAGMLIHELRFEKE
ncbi:MAG: DUF4783 domain-containing protein [Bacteroidota bacterium]